MHGKQILITGITGFIGSHLTRVLKQTFPSCNIIGIGRSRSQNQDNYDFYEVNLLNREALFDIINRIKPDYIFHLKLPMQPFKPLQ
jgi:nucleoside-diphosphate-sugar epimerase